LRKDKDKESPREQDTAGGDGKFFFFVKVRENIEIGTITEVTLGARETIGIGGNPLIRLEGLASCSAYQIAKASPLPSQAFLVEPPDPDIETIFQ
jgi:hypothetical protein